MANLNPKPGSHDPRLQDGLQDLVQDLRRHGYKAGVDQYLSAQNLFLIWQSQPELDSEVLRASLGALFCSTEDEQQRFPPLFQAWYQGCIPQTTEAETELLAQAPTWAETVKLDKKSWLLIVLGSILLLIILFRVLEQKEAPPPKPPTVETVDNKTTNEAATKPAPPINTQLKPRTPPEPIIVPDAFYPIKTSAFLKSLCGLPLIVWFAWLLYRLRLRYLTLAKQRSQPKDKNRLEHLPFKGHENPLFPTHVLKTVWQAWRRFQPFRSRRLHTARTIRSTLNQNGYFQAEFRDRLLPPEYVVLIDRRHYHDFSARLGNELLQRLRNEGLFINSYYYDTDPRYCWPQAQSDRFYSLQQLAQRHQGQHLLIIGDAQSFYRDADRSILPLGNSEAWTQKILLSNNTPTDWQDAEHALLQAGFTLSPFTRQGITQVLNYAKTPMQPADLAQAKALDYRDTPLPIALHPLSYSWLINRKPKKAQQQQSITALKQYLGKEGYELLAAIAAYPAVDWDLALALDCQLQLQGDESQEIRLRKLARLPWLRNGQLPDTWRKLIIRSLQSDQIKRISACYQALLNADKNAQSIIELPVAIPDLKHAKQDQNEWLNSAKRGDPLQDRVFASVIRGRKPSLLEFALPQQFQHWLPPQYWRGLLGKAIKWFIVAIAFSFGLWQAWQQWGATSLAQQAEQQMHTELVGIQVNIAYLRDDLQPLAQALQQALTTWGIKANAPSAAPPLQNSSQRVNQVLNSLQKNQIEVPQQVPEKIVQLVEQRLRYLTYGAPIQIKATNTLQPEMVNISLQQAFAEGSVYRDFINAKASAVSEPMVIIPAGSFQMGSDTSPDEQPVHTVKIKSFALSRYEVTFEEYDRFAEASGKLKPDDQFWGRDKRPVINVSWDDARAYAAWLSKQTGQHYRLPTEAEWEYAARAGTTTDFYWGDADAKDYAWFNENAYSLTHPVGEKKANAFGLYDMSGNVWEWVQDCYVPYYSEAPTEKILISLVSAWEKMFCSYRIQRGGSWDGRRVLAGSAVRIGEQPAARGSSTGFRLAQDLP